MTTWGTAVDDLIGCGCTAVFVFHDKVFRHWSMSAERGDHRCWATRSDTAFETTLGDLVAEMVQDIKNNLEARERAALEEKRNAPGERQERPRP